MASRPRIYSLLRRAATHDFCATSAARAPDTVFPLRFYFLLTKGGTAQKEVRLILAEGETDRAGARFGSLRKAFSHTAAFLLDRQAGNRAFELLTSLA